MHNNGAGCLAFTENHGSFVLQKFLAKDIQPVIFLKEVSFLDDLNVSF